MPPNQEAIKGFSKHTGCEVKQPGGEAAVFGLWPLGF